MFARRFLPYSLLLFALLCSVVPVFAQESVDIMDYYDGKERFFRLSNAFLYKIDEFAKSDELQGEDLKKAKAYFRVFYDDEDRPISSGYYIKERNADKGVDIVKLTQHVNQDKLAYHVVKYEYNFYEAPDRVSEKYFKNEEGKVVNYHRYTWNPKTGNLIKVESFSNNLYVSQMEPRGSYSLIWKDKSLQRIVFLNSANKKIEQYTFMDNFIPKGKLTSFEDPLFSIGNNNISIAYLKKYDRYKDNDKELLYYILYNREGKGLREEKYSTDRILLKEKFYKVFAGFGDTQEK